MRPVSRRTFLHAGTLTVLGAAVGCGRSEKRSAVRSIDQIIAGRPQGLEVIPAGTEMLPEDEERLAFGLFRIQARTPIPGATGTIYVAPDRTSPALGPFRFVYHGDGLGDRGIYATTVRFPKAGKWLVLAEAVLPGAEDPVIGGAEIQVGIRNDMPKSGDPAISVPTPTVQNARGVDPICTAKPACAMHAISLDDALQNGKPTVLIIATPGFCQSRLCGPEVEITEEVAQATGDRANFVHIEVYRSDDPDVVARALLSPAAAAWKLEEEPAIYYINAAGVITHRHLGPVDRTDVRLAVQTLLA